MEVRGSALSSNMNVECTASRGFPSWKAQGLGSWPWVKAGKHDEPLSNKPPTLCKGHEIRPFMVKKADSCCFVLTPLGGKGQKSPPPLPTAAPQTSEPHPPAPETSSNPQTPPPNPQPQNSYERPPAQQKSPRPTKKHPAFCCHPTQAQASRHPGSSPSSELRDRKVYKVLSKVLEVGGLALGLWCFGLRILGSGFWVLGVWCLSFGAFFD